MMRCTACPWIVVGFALIFGLPAGAQPPGPRPSPAEYLGRLDANRDGVLQMDEVPPGDRPVVARLAQAAKLDPRQPLPLERLKQALARGVPDRSDSSDDEKDDDDSSSKTKSTDDEDAVPGFGVDDELAKPPGFGDGADVVPLEQRYDRKVIQYVEGILRRYDRNRNGQLDANEWRDVRWTSDPHKSDLNKDGVLSKAEFCERIARRWGQAANEQKSSGGSGNSSGGASPSTKLRDYAKNLLRQYDANKNGVLEKDEWSKMKSRYHDADRNRDQRISVDELAQKLASFSEGGASGSGGDNRSTSSRPSEGHRRPPYRRPESRDQPPRNSYRFLTPTERLPDGLPEWFTRNDANGDGQIAMAEFSAAWSPTKAAEFRKLDRNGDGFVSAGESLVEDEE